MASTSRSGEIAKVVPDSPLENLAKRLAAAERVTVLTGAGVSAASGIPTFRGDGGLWKRFRAEDLATPEAFARDPRLVWEWYEMRRRAIAAASPNAAHRVIASWSRSPRFSRFTLVTQNVDGLHELAGTRPECIVRFHGSIWTLRCVDACRASEASDGWEDRTTPLPELPPRCPSCGGLARPGVVWFGEAIPTGALVAADAALDCDVCIAVGTSALVMPAAGLIDEARRRGAWTAEVNVEATPSSDRVDAAISGKAEEILPEIDARFA
jgi:NAD-dependent deacetylase